MHPSVEAAAYRLACPIAAVESRSACWPLGRSDGERVWDLYIVYIYVYFIRVYGFNNNGSLVLLNVQISPGPNVKIFPGPKLSRKRVAFCAFLRPI